MPKEKRRRNKRRRMPRKFKRPRSSSGSSSDRKQQRRVDAVISQAAPIIATTAILASQGHFSEAGSSSGPQPSTSGATSSSASNVPMVCPKPALMNCLQKVGARGTCFTRKEVLKYLIQYIGERMLYDQSNPRVVYCREDELGKALGVPQFTIYNVKDVLAANCVPVTSPQVIQADTQTSASQAKVHYTLQHSVAEGRETATRPKSTQAECQDAAMPGPSTVPQKAKEKRKHRRRNKLSESEKSTSSTGSSTRRRRHSSSLSIGQTLQLDEEGPKGLPWFYFVKCPKESEKRSSGSCTERWSIDGYSTAYVADSSDDLWFLEEDSDREEVIDWEFELDSDSSEPYNDDDDEEDSIDGEEEEYYVEMIQCSDNDSCMADESEESTDEEITDKDKWKCDVCPMRNHPCQRFCSHCWALRKDWFPEVHNSSQKSTLQRSNSCPEAQSMENADTSGAMDPSPSVVSPPERTISTDSAFSSLGSSSQEVNSSAPGAAGVSQDHVGAVVMEPCMICLSRPKVASMVHGRTAHLVCCYTCAKKLYKRGKPCPVCRRPIQMVVKTFFA
ncbi:PREDICTED: E3 ubiquitin-protein ligase Mdm2-like [Branchiostoma belcheri]|uniref:E3 ubiquitin-protein ligase Mdm2-like n=1 Tax=Branchiostoma belcheri TaxID=7741 RepID=A0A6P4YUP8_BRABE|nr:PREDICTED: E3 ubiquitin-protein ligase Mdm2-like [Branchiostoma belcheri]